MNQHNTEFTDSFKYLFCLLKLSWFLTIVYLIMVILYITLLLTKEFSGEFYRFPFILLLIGLPILSLLYLFSNFYILIKKLEFNLFSKIVTIGASIIASLIIILTLFLWIFADKFQGMGGGMAVIAYLMTVVLILIGLMILHFISNIILIMRNKKSE